MFRKIQALHYTKATGRVCAGHNYFINLLEALEAQIRDQFPADYFENKSDLYEQALRYLFPISDLVHELSLTLPRVYLDDEEADEFDAWSLLPFISERNPRVQDKFWKFLTISKTQ